MIHIRVKLRNGNYRHSGGAIWQWKDEIHAHAIIRLNTPGR